MPVWDANLTSENAQLRAAVAESYRSAIEFAALVRATHVVLHPGFCRDPHFSKVTARERAAEALRSLAELGRKLDQLLLVENVGTVQSSIFDQHEYAAFLDDFPEGVGYLVDIGHAHINGWNIETLIRATSDRLYAVHIHDNDGNNDAHKPMGEGTIRWNDVFNTVKSCGRDLGLILEYNLGTDPRKLTEGKAELVRVFWE